MEQELWKAIRGYEGYYEISNLGRIKSLDKYRIGGSGGIVYLKPFKSGDDYRAVGLRKNGVKTTHLVHILVATYFIPNPDRLPEVDHKDFDRSNNRHDNLRWSTHDDNIKHSSKEGRMSGAKGEKSPRAKHTNEDVLKIRELYASGNYTQDEIASMFGVKRHNVAKIVLRQRWAHI